MYLLKLNSGSSGTGEGNDSTSNDSGFVPSGFTLLQNFPNPFNSGTKIQYYMPENGSVKIDVIDILGNKVSVLINAVKNEGWHTFVYNPEGLSSGIYLLRAESKHHMVVKKILYLK